MYFPLEHSQGYMPDLPGSRPRGVDPIDYLFQLSLNTKPIHGPFDTLKYRFTG